MNKLASSIGFAADSRGVAFSRTATALAFFPAVYPILVGGHNVQRLAQLALLAALGVWTVASGGINTIASGARNWRLQPICALFLLGTVSASLAFAPLNAFVELAVLFMLLVLAARIAHECERSPDESLMAVLSALGAGCLVYIVTVVAAYAAALTFQLPMPLDAFAPGFENRRFLNHAQTVSLPLLGLLVALSASKHRLSTLWFATAACWWTLLFATAGRGTFVGIAVGCAVTLPLMGKAGRLFCKALSFQAVAGLIVYVVTLVVVPVALGMEPFGLLGGVGERSMANPTSGRIELWLKALELMGSHPLLGIGPVHYAYRGLTGSLTASPHNWPLQFGAEWGIPAALIMMFVVACGVRTLILAGVALDLGEARRRTVLSAFIVTAIAIVVDSLVSSSMVMPLSQVTIALFIGVATGWLAGYEKHRRPLTTRHAVRGLIGLVLSAAVAIIVWGAASYFNIAVGIEKEPVRAMYNPRMWKDGKF